MKKNTQNQEFNNILVDENSVASFIFTAYETGVLEVQFTINNPKGFHNSEEAKNDMNGLMEAALQASKDKLSTYVATEN